MALAARRIARVHKILGLVIGLQFLFWTSQRPVLHAVSD